MEIQSLAVGLSLLFDLHVQVRHEHLLGNCPSGDRRLYFGAQGSFEGPRLRGQLVDGGDWLTARKDGVIVQDVGFLLQTHDGASIAYRHRGIRHEEAAARGGETAQYFLTAPQFETSDSRYDWLNRIVAIGRGKKDGLTVRYSVYEANPQRDR